MSDLETKFRYLEIFPGVALPITWSIRDEILAVAANGAANGSTAYLATYDTIRPQLDCLVDDGMFPYLAELLQLPADAPADTVEAALFRARAEHLGLAADAARDEVLSQERRISRCLTIGKLRTARDKRNGTYVSLINDGRW